MLQKNRVRLITVFWKTMKKNSVGNITIESDVDLERIDPMALKPFTA